MRLDAPKSGLRFVIVRFSAAPKLRSREGAGRIEQLGTRNILDQPASVVAPMVKKSRNSEDLSIPETRVTVS
jgi:hypothetical protein